MFEMGICYFYEAYVREIVLWEVVFLGGRLEML